MIAGRAICKILDGMTIDIKGRKQTIQTNLGNQDALQKFIYESTKRRQPKFPLLFYVVKQTEKHNGWHFVDTELIIMMNTKEHFLYKERTDKTYTAVIDPIYDMTVKALNQQPYFVSLFEDKQSKYSYIDRPNYAIKQALPVGDKQKKSAVAEYVDARVIKLKGKVKTDCII